MRVLLNGSPREVDAGATVQSLVASLPEATQGRGVADRGGADRGVAGRGVAVAVDGEVIPRGQWGSTRLQDGARLEVVVAVQGG